jgi:hypothetical protein
MNTELCNTPGDISGATGAVCNKAADHSGPHEDTRKIGGSFRWIIWGGRS